MNISLALYFKSFLSTAVGSSLAEKLTHLAFDRRAEEASTELDHDLASFFYPSLGILRGLVSLGFAEEEAGELVFTMWEFAPAGFKERPWATPRHLQ